LGVLIDAHWDRGGKEKKGKKEGLDGRTRHNRMFVEGVLLGEKRKKERGGSMQRKVVRRVNISFPPKKKEEKREGKSGSVAAMSDDPDFEYLNRRKGKKEGGGECPNHHASGPQQGGERGKGEERAGCL